MRVIKGKNGFTLLELLISLSIISIIGLAFFTIINMSIKGNGKNEKDIKALQISQSEIENIRSQIKKNNEDITIYADYLFTNNEIDKNTNNEKIKVNFNEGEFKTKYVKNLNDDLFLIDINIGKSDVTLNNRKEERLYDIKINTSLIGKKNGEIIIEDKYKYISKKDTKIRTKIVSQAILSNIVNPEPIYSNGAIFLKLQSGDPGVSGQLMVGNYIKSSQNNDKLYNNNDDHYLVENINRENHSITLTYTKSSTNKIKLSSIIDGNKKDDIISWGDKLDYYNCKSVLIDPKSYDNNGNNNIKINDIRIVGYKLNSQDTIDLGTNNSGVNGNEGPLEFKINDENIYKIDISFNVEFGEHFNVGYIVLGKEQK